MFDIDTSSKRFRLAVLFFSYGAMTVATILGTIVLVLFAMGYRFDTNFKFAQGGLVQFNSFPNNAVVSVDGMQQNFHTPGNANLSAGHHTIDLSLAGYQPWRKTVSLAAGQLLWLSYVRLIPNHITTTNLRDFDSLAGLLPSPDKHWLLIQPKSDAASFILADVSDPKQPKFTDLQVPDAQLSKQNGQIGTVSLVEWDANSQFVLLKEQNGSSTSFIRLDRSNAPQVVNISTKFGFAISEVHFSPDNANILFANTGGVLRRLDLGNGSASDVLVSNLQQFTVLNSNQVAFVSTEQSTAEQLVGIWQNNQITTVRRVPTGEQLRIVYDSYEGHTYLAIASSGSTKVDIVRDPNTTVSKDQTALFSQLELGVVPTWITFSPGGHMLAAQSGKHVAVFDFEEAKAYQATLNFTASAIPNVAWLDDFYLWSDAGGTARLFEFDGQNVRTITAVASGYIMTLSSDGKLLLSVGNIAGGKLDLQSSNLTTGN
jgi:hypothetical protein